MNKKINIIIIPIILMLLINNLLCSDDNTIIKKPIDFVINECILEIPYGYDIGVSSDLDIVFAVGFNGEFKNRIYISLKITEGNATKILLDDVKKSSSFILDKVYKIGHLNIIEYKNHSDIDITGKHFQIYGLNKDNNHTKELIDYCNKTWHEDMQIDNLELLPDKLLKDFPFMFKRKDAIRIQKKLQSIADNKLKQQ